MLTHLQSLALGIVQGLTELLPISSSAHLILIPRLFGWPDSGLAFDVALHMGTLAAIVSYFWKDLTDLLRGALSPKDPSLALERRLLGQILLATLPAGLAGLFLEDTIESVFRSPHLIAYPLIGMGILLAIADYLSRGNKILSDITWGMAFILGVAQALALVPGVSRSGVTITTALFLGLQRPTAARFSFLMAIPITAGAGLMKFKEILHRPDLTIIFLGFAGAAVSGFLAIWILLRYVQNHRYTPFAVYRVILGAYLLMNLDKLK